MTNSHYCSGDEIHPGDTVKLANGLTGKVTMVMELPGGDPNFPAAQRFFVSWSDGTSLDYLSSDPGVSLLSPAPRMTSSTMHSTIKREEFLRLMADLGSHSLYYPERLSMQLAECGISTSLPPEGRGITIEGQFVPVSTPEFGDPGISTLSILGTIYELATGEPARSKMNGRGFWYQDVMNKLASHWGLVT